MNKTDLITKLIKEDKITFEEACILMELKSNANIRPQYYPPWDTLKVFPQVQNPYTVTCTCNTSGVCNCVRYGTTVIC